MPAKGRVPGNQRPGGLERAVQIQERQRFGHARGLKATKSAGAPKRTVHPWQRRGLRVKGQWELQIILGKVRSFRHPQRAIHRF